MPPAAPVPTTAPPIRATVVVSIPTLPCVGGTFRTVNVICEVPDTAPRVAVIVIVYVVSTDTVGAETVTCWWPVAARVNVDGVSVIAGDGVRGRKSTRLNSSHSQISYAVFCLKKKKKKYRARSGAASTLALVTRTHRIEHIL